ncbi:hypothetical protein BH10PSE18_BH10PSE18_13900 [soil metagenome]|jgi:hypothetical protein
MFLSFVSKPAVILMVAAPLLLAACQTPPPAPEVPAVDNRALPVPTPVTVMPVEAEPVAPATQPPLAFTPVTMGPMAAMLAYADKLRPLGATELAAELVRLGEPGEVPVTQMRAALVLAQTRVPADLARALGLMQRVIASSSPDAAPLQPLARTLAARYMEQRRVEDDRDRQVQALRDSQRRIDQLNDRIEALRAIERSFARPNQLPGNGSGARPSP